MLTLNNIRSPKGAHRGNKRLGRGRGSGQGLRAGKGDKGQKARSGGGVRPGFEGGNLPLYMRLPKRRIFTNHRFKKEIAIINLEILDKLFDEGEEISKENLIEKGLLKGKKRKWPIKILAKGKSPFKKELTFINIEKFSKTAQELITKANGKI